MGITQGLLNKQESNSFKQELFLLFDCNLLKAKKALEKLNNYIFYYRENKILQSENAVIFLYNHLKLTIQLLKEIYNNLENNSIDTENLIRLESEIRVLIQSITFAELALTWRSPASSQSLISQFFDLTDQVESTRILYERSGHKELERVERQILKTFGLTDEHFNCTVVSSGMAALSLIESFLLRNVLKKDDTILITPRIYFEFEAQLKSLRSFKIVEMNSYSIEDIIKLTEENEVKVIFMDFLTNNSHQRMIDVEGLLNHYQNQKNCPILVIDGTMLPYAAIPYIASFPHKDRIFYVESCSKYLQLGMDMTMSGVLITDAKFKYYFSNLRSSMGYTLTEHGAHLFPLYKREQVKNKISRIEENAHKIALALSSDTEIKKICQVIYPGINSHPDYYIAKKINRAGGCIVFKLIGRDVKTETKKIIEIILENAKINNIPMVKGLSFGFSFPRITADFPTDINGSIEKNVFYLRLYVGDQIQISDDLIELIRLSFKQYDKQRY